ncbi:hypothetical protein X471_00079 [Bartonella bacilliformis str. Heidi Mejia]|uniref:BA14K family protein n=1 Tax=Bartonella bacilliformis TaxID=774 RepID=UPI000448D141|nr:BA14K family protein [Bartonella bacilliformis]EYS92589.1 hypothetical protein X471_00079 [Bartonella bacilliformis str. Heidi Mejia]KEG19120.1 hypothetical protein H707_00866 [Bartonella bacilliformis Hosp800-02]KEG22321.1 hypothetical protein H708_00874 [Bartonella bacilliformis VAB9028]KEG24577.1 hypothetical protein H706_00876 [Bartonella bacilliformis CAR600-02]
MKKLVKFAVLSAVSTITISALSTTAFAYEGYERIQKNIAVHQSHQEHSTHHHHHYHQNSKIETRTREYHIHHNNNNTGDTLAAGALGLAAGAILGNILQKPAQPQIIYQPVPQSQVIYQVQPTTIHHRPIVPQEQISQWLAYCSKTYRSFNPRTGTFRGHDGLDYFCYAPVNN